MRVVLAVDPGSTSGVALWGVGLPWGYIASSHYNIERAGWSEEAAVRELDSLLADHEWLAGVEHPYTHRKGRAQGQAPSYAERHWRVVLGLLARHRAMRAGVAFRTPMVLRPSATEWRAPLGLPTKGVGVDSKERRLWLKRKAIERLWRVHQLVITQPDEAEAASIGEYLARLAALPKMPGKQIVLRTPKFVP